MEILKKLVKIAGNQSKACKILSVNPSAFSAWVNGKRETPPYIIKSAKAHIELARGKK